MPLISKITVTSLVAAVAILGAACDDNSEGAALGATATPTATTEVTATPTGTISAGKDVMPTGTTFVFVRGTEGGSLLLDPAVMLDGEEALEAAHEDGAIPADEELPNDFYIRNLEIESLIFPVADDATFTLIGFDANGGFVDVEVDRAAFEALLLGGATTQDETTQYYGFIPTELPMTVEIEDGEVTGGRQQYLP